MSVMISDSVMLVDMFFVTRLKCDCCVFNVTLSALLCRLPWRHTAQLQVAGISDPQLHYFAITKTTITVMATLCNDFQFVTPQATPALLYMLPLCHKAQLQVAGMAGPQ